MGSDHKWIARWPDRPHLGELLLHDSVRGHTLSAGVVVTEYVPVTELSAVSEFVAFLRGCGPASNPAEWHRLMAKHDPGYAESETGRAYRALGGQ